MVRIFHVVRFQNAGDEYGTTLSFGTERLALSEISYMAILELSVWQFG